jgi:hypothetical protein
MGLNSWDIVGDYLVGSPELLRVSERNSSPDITDTNVTNSFATQVADLTSLSGTDVVALYGLISMSFSTSNDRGILAVREVGDTTASSSDRVTLMYLAAQLGANNAVLRLPLWTPARGTDPGKFQYAERSTSLPVNAFYYWYWGRMRP